MCVCAFVCFMLFNVCLCAFLCDVFCGVVWCAFVCVSVLMVSLLNAVVCVCV